MPEKEVIDATTQFIVNVGVVGALAIILLLGFGFVVYKVGLSAVSVADRFVTGTLETQARLVESSEAQSVMHHQVMAAITTTQAQIQQNQERMANRLDTVCRGPR